MKVKVRRDRKEEIEIDVNDLRYDDEFDISKGGEVIATGTITDAWECNGACRVEAIITFKKESKSWDELGYDCFEDMIDDIAKGHGSLGHKEDAKIKKNAACFNAADSYGESYIEIKENGAKTIVHADSVTVYPVTKED